MWMCNFFFFTNCQENRATDSALISSSQYHLGRRLTKELNEFLPTGRAWIVIKSDNKVTNKFIPHTYIRDFEHDRECDSPGWCRFSVVNGCGWQADREWVCKCTDRYHSMGCLGESGLDLQVECRASQACAQGSHRMYKWAQQTSSPSQTVG